MTAVTTNLTELRTFDLQPLRLGVNIDHVATVRNARGGAHPDPVRMAKALEAEAVDGVTAHLREDRRHIRDDDVERIAAEVRLPLNFEMAATDEMRAIALRIKPHAACLVPERREERTTEGGLDVIGGGGALNETIVALDEAGMRVSLFIEADPRQIEAAAKTAARVVEIHVGRYCEALHDGRDAEAEAERARIERAAWLAHNAGLEVHAGHGLSFQSVEPIAAIAPVVELNIGHFLVGEALFTGFAQAVATMRSHMDAGRARAAEHIRRAAS